MTLDIGRAVATPGFHDIGVQGALHQEIDAALARDGPGGRLEAADELTADDLAFGFGVRDAGQRLQETILLIGDHQPHAGRRHEILLDLLGLAGAQQAVIDEHAGQLIADGALHQSSRDRRIDATGQPAQHLPVADLRADRRDLLGDEILARPVGGQPGHVVQEVLDDLLAQLGVSDLGMPLHTGEPTIGVGERRHRGAQAVREPTEAGRFLGHGVAVAHPDVERLRDSGQQRRRLVHLEMGTPELGGVGAAHHAAQRLGHRLEAVADAEDRHPRGEQRRVDLRGAAGVDRLRAARQDDGLRVAGEHLGHRRGMGHDLGIDVRLTHPAGNELGVLRAKVDDNDRS